MLKDKLFKFQTTKLVGARDKFSNKHMEAIRVNYFRFVGFLTSISHFHCTLPL